MQKFFVFLTAVLMVVGVEFPAQSGLRGPTGVKPLKQKESRPLGEKVVARENEYQRAVEQFPGRWDEFHKRTAAGKLSDGSAWSKWTGSDEGTQEWLKFLGDKERQDKAEQKRLAREKEIAGTRAARLKSSSPEVRQEAAVRERELLEKQDKEKRREMERVERRRATDDEIERKMRSVRENDRDLDMKQRAVREAAGNRERELDRRNNLERPGRGTRSNDDVPRGRSNDDIPRGRPNEDAPRARPNRDEGADVMRRGLDEDQRGMAESQRRRQKAIDDDLRGGEEGQKRIQRGLDEDMRGAQAQQERIKRSMDEDMKYARRTNDDEDVVRASRTGIDSFKKQRAGANYDDPEVDARLDQKVKELLSNPNTRINEDGSVTVNNRAKGQSARARDGTAQASRSSRGSSASKRSLSASQIKAIYARGDD